MLCRRPPAGRTCDEHWRALPAAHNNDVRWRPLTHLARWLCLISALHCTACLPCCAFCRLQALQRQLPRPLALPDSLLSRRTPAAAGGSLAGADAAALREAAEELVVAEMAALLQHDAIKYPVKDAK